MPPFPYACQYHFVHSSSKLPSKISFPVKAELRKELYKNKLCMLFSNLYNFICTYMHKNFKYPLQIENCRAESPPPSHIPVKRKIKAQDHDL